MKEKYKDKILTLFSTLINDIPLGLVNSIIFKIYIFSRILVVSEKNLPPLGKQILTEKFFGFFENFYLWIILILIILFECFWFLFINFVEISLKYYYI